MTQFFNHESQGEITNKKDSYELKNWINHLDNIKKELEYLVGLVKKHTKDESLLASLTQHQMENSNELSAFYNYAPSITDSQECDDVDCDIFYLNKHEEFRDKYIVYLKKYWELKTETFETLLK